MFIQTHNKLTDYKSMWQYLAQNFKADVNSLVLLNLWVFNQTLMDFVTEISFCIKTPVVHEKGWFLEVGSELGKSFKVSV